MKQMGGSPSSPPSSTDTMSFSSQPEDQNAFLNRQPNVVLKKEAEDLVLPQQNIKTLGIKENKTTSGTSLQLPSGKDMLPELQLPIMDWTQDAFWAQLNSPWLQNLTPTYSNVLHF